MNEYSGNTLELPDILMSYDSYYTCIPFYRVLFRQEARMMNGQIKAVGIHVAVF